MEAFWSDAESLFETARLASETGAPDCDMAILVRSGGAIQVVEASGWALTGLAAHHGARAAYRITRSGGRTLLEGRAGAAACLFREDGRAETACQLLNARVPVYQACPRLLAEVPK